MAAECSYFVLDRTNQGESTRDSGPGEEPMPNRRFLGDFALLLAAALGGYGLLLVGFGLGL